MKHVRKWATVLLTILMIITPLSAFAAEENTEKEEVVYINLNADGSVKEINVVNIFEPDGNGKIIDYGKYESLRNMTTTDEISYSNETVTMHVNADKIYCEGRLGHNIIPWDIAIHYYMDGKEYTADEIAGRSGKLEIKMSIRENKNCNSSYFEGYALQVTFVFDTEKAADIVTEDATIANVGADKQLSYTILPNNEKDILISADVKNFEMTGIAINGIRMNLNFDIDDSVLQDKIDEVINAVNDLDSGASQLNNGASDIYQATGKLNTAASELSTGVGNLLDGATELNNGLSSIAEKNQEITGAAWSAYEALCSAAQTQLNAKLSENGLSAVTLTPTTYSDVLLGVLAKFDADAVYKEAYEAVFAGVTAQVQAQADTLYAEYIRSQASDIYQAYVESQADALYAQAASEAVIRQLVESGSFPNEQAAMAYLQTEEGKALVANTVATMTNEQKNQIITTAVQSLTDKQKEQILQGAVASLTEEQKAEIRNGYIAQLMASDEVTEKLSEAVKTVNAAAAEVSALKGQLDSYGAFYRGLVAYTDAVDSAANGAGKLTNGLSTLHSNTNTLKNAVGDLHLAVGTLNDGTNELREGTQEFSSETSDMNTQVSDEIDSISSTMTGADVQTISFVSEKNTNITSVQFVIQTEDIKAPGPDTVVIEEAKPLTFWQKLLKLFGLYE